MFPLFTLQFIEYSLEGYETVIGHERAGSYQHDLDPASDMVKNEIV